MVDELRGKQFSVSLELIKKFFKNYPKILINSMKQKGQSTYFRKRTPKDSQIDISKSLKDQFNLLRVVDNEKYPAWFKYKNRKYQLSIEVMKKK